MASIAWFYEITNITRPAVMLSGGSDIRIREGPNIACLANTLIGHRSIRVREGTNVTRCAAELAEDRGIWFIWCADVRPDTTAPYINRCCVRIEKRAEIPRWR